VALRGEADGAPLARLVLTPADATFPWRWPDGTADEQAFTLTNTGAAAVKLGAADLGCSAAWAAADAPAVGTEIAAGEALSFHVTHTPAEPDPELCTFSFAAEAGATVEGSLLRYVPPTWGTAPTVALVAPLAGTVASTDERLTVSFTLADDDSPPSGVLITIWSTAQKKTLAQGVAPDDSGRVDFALAKTDLVAGAETLRVSLLDWEGFTTYDAVPFRVDTLPADDADGDSWGVADGDCDDTDAAAFPGAVETANGVDDDCDGVVDDGAPTLDNDGDAFTEAAGDCNDHDADTFPGAAEVANNLDDDCDGAADEGTVRTDDDGDGYAELAGDCDDADAAVNPAATDVCSGADRDCDGVVEPCAGAAGAFATATPDVCRPGDAVALAATVAAGSTLAWTVDAGTLSDTTAATPTLTCPDAAGRVAVALTATDADGGQAFDTLRVEVVPTDASLADTQTLGGCGGSAAVALGLLGGAGALRRRRG
jgi:hypothetical protein